MWPDQVSNPGPLTYKSGALPTALPSPASNMKASYFGYLFSTLSMTSYYLEVTVTYISWPSDFMPPTLEKLRGHIGLGLSVHLSVCL